MARPKRLGLGYFPLDTDYLNDRKIQRLLSTHGTSGVMVYLTLLCEIYGRYGYYMEYNETTGFDIAFSLHLSEKQVDRIFRFCLKVNLFENTIWKEEGKITSSGIQDRYLNIQKRNGAEIDPALLCLTETGVFVTETTKKTTKTRVNATKTKVSVTKTPTKGKGKGNGKGKESEKEKEKEEEKKAETGLNNFLNSTNYEENGDQNDDARRRAELLRMAADATASAGNA